MLSKHPALLFGIALSLVLNASSAHAKVGYVGIGVVIAVEHKVASIDEVRPDSSAAKAGVVAGDQLLDVDHQTVTNLIPQQIGVLIRGNGEPGTEVVLTLKDPKTFAIRDVKVGREYVEIPCLAEGWVALHLSGNESQGYFTGCVGGEEHSCKNGHAIYWVVTDGKASGRLNVMNVTFDLAKTGENFALTGKIGDTDLKWMSNGLDWELDQACIH